MKDKAYVLGFWLALLMSFASCVVVAVTIPAGIGYCQSVVLAFNEARLAQEDGNAIRLREVAAKEKSNQIEAQKVKVLARVADGLERWKKK